MPLLHIDPDDLIAAMEPVTSDGEYNGAIAYYRAHGVQLQWSPSLLTGNTWASVRVPEGQLLAAMEPVTSDGEYPALVPVVPRPAEDAAMEPVTSDGEYNWQTLYSSSEAQSLQWSPSLLTGNTQPAP